MTTGPQTQPGGAGVVLLTGATGFLGGALARALQEGGLSPRRLRCLVRDPERARRLGLPAETLCRGDLSTGDPVGDDPPGASAELRAAVEGVDAVVHLAGSLKAYDQRGFDAVNVGGAARLAAAVAAVAPCAHFVLVSSLAAVGPSVDGSGTDAEPARCRPVSQYGASKHRGELAVVARVADWSIVRPPVVYGPGDGATRLLFRQACAPLCAVPRRARPLSVIHADDVVRALQLVLQRRPRGAVLPLDGPERTDTHALMRAIAAACGRTARLLPVPMALAGGAALACDLWARLRRSASYFNRDKMREIQAPGWVADGEAARRALDFTPRVRLDAGLRDVAEREGLVRAATSATA